MKVRGQELPRLHLTDSMRDAIVSESKNKLPRESGGILIGTVEEKDIIVHAVVGPGPKARHGRYCFVRDGDYAQQQLDAMIDSSGGEWDYVAEWHSHTAMAGPSLQDLESIQFISRAKGYGVPEPILVICCRASRQRWVLKAYQLKNKILMEITVSITPSLSIAGTDSKF